MRLDSVAQLLGAQSVSTGRLDAALRIAAPRALGSCGTAKAPLRPPQFRDAVIAALPTSLAVGIVECVCRRWWPTQSETPSLPDEIVWTLRPRLEWLHEGSPTASVVVMAHVRLAQPPLPVAIAVNAGKLSVGEDRSWSAWLTLAVGDEGCEPATFYESRAEVHLPRGPWNV